jgi:hypothetical protein
VPLGLGLTILDRSCVQVSKKVDHESTEAERLRQVRCGRGTGRPCGICAITHNLFGTFRYPRKSDGPCGIYLRSKQQRFSLTPPDDTIFLLYKPLSISTSTSSILFAYCSATPILLYEMQARGKNKVDWTTKVTEKAAESSSDSVSEKILRRSESPPFLRVVVIKHSCLP